VRIAFGEVAQSVAIYLGIPLLAGAITRFGGVRLRGRPWYDDIAMPRLAPVALLALLFTIVVMFALQGSVILARPLDVLRIALPLVCYFALMFFGAYWLARRAGLGYAETASLAFTAAGNNFELAIAVAVGTFGIASGEALAAAVGPLIEVPALVGLVYVALWLARRFAAAPALLPQRAVAVTERRRVLFLCTHNSARSQIAEGWLRHLAGDRYEVHSAGTEATRVRPLAIRDDG